MELMGRAMIMMAMTTMGMNIEVAKFSLGLLASFMCLDLFSCSDTFVLYSLLLCLLVLFGLACVLLSACILSLEFWGACKL